MTQIAFELRSELTSGKKEDRFAGGSLTVNGETVDVTELLGEDGKIILNPVPADLKRRDKEADEAFDARTADEAKRARRDERLVDALDGYPALRRATVNGGAKAEEG